MLRTIGISLFAALFILIQAQAGSHEDSDSRARNFVELSGFEGNEEALGAAVAASIMEISPTKNANHDFSESVRENVLVTQSLRRFAPLTSTPPTCTK